MPYVRLTILVLEVGFSFRSSSIFWDISRPKVGHSCEFDSVRAKYS